ncbi:SH3 domain-containing C40 family peptidase [Lewinella sp. JB7]|uniref:C40 family peptidase n=1 Tax=Lewinella sp. JB7 TaxID=2962887 RepID=UPI0020CA1983|nr:SH3 domain-containing C40 family peptidase [Lewinella sp. JB7]MCP9236510.1 C40 family peptidase [Lewinella sp. JB7]
MANFSCGADAPDGGMFGEINDQLTQLRATHAPDRRTDRVEVEAVERADSLILRGYTTVPAAREQFRAWAQDNPLVVDSTRLLIPGDTGEDYGLVRVSVANIRTEPGHSRELTSQALMGTPLQVLDEQNGWYLIRTPDRYLAWLEGGAFTRMDRATVVGWFNDDLRSCVPAQSTVLSEPGGGRVVSELVAGNLMQTSGRRQAEYDEVTLPDGRMGWVPTNDLQPYRTLATPTEVRVPDIIATAFAQVGKPYLWGGTSPKAMDCSGFTKTAYYLNGYVIPRDASQQVHAGTEIPLDSAYSQLLRGDLLFFGNHRPDGSERVTHVGFYLEDGRFLHAGADNDYITENSLMEDDPDYAPHRRESLLRARRLRESGAGVVPIDSAFRAIYTRSSSR